MQDAQKLYFEGTSPGAQLVRDAGYLKNRSTHCQPTLYVDSKSLEGEKQETRTLRQRILTLQNMNGRAGLSSVKALHLPSV